MVVYKGTQTLSEVLKGVLGSIRLTNLEPIKLKWKLSVECSRIVDLQWGQWSHVQGGRKEVKKSNHFVLCKNKVKMLFLAHQLRGNIHPFSLITLTKPWHFLL